MKIIVKWLNHLSQISKEQRTEDILIKMYRFGLYLQENKNIDDFTIDFNQSEYSFSIILDVGESSRIFKWLPYFNPEKSIKCFFDEIENHTNTKLK